MEFLSYRKNKKLVILVAVETEFSPIIVMVKLVN